MLSSFYNGWRACLSMEYDEFKQYYKDNGRCKGDAFKRKNPYTEAQLKTRYKNYMKKYNKAGATKDQEIREIVLERDGEKCRLYGVLTEEEKTALSSEQIITELDCAHIFPKSVYPWMRYNPANIVLLFRTFHNRLDEHRHPITNKLINAEQVKDWWKRIVGEDAWLMLEDEAKNGR